MQSRKRGRLGKTETQYILAHIGAMTIDEIAHKLNRHVDPIKAFIKKNGVPSKTKTNYELDRERSEKLLIRQELLGSEAWQRLKQELTQEELKYFEEKYISLIGQFRSDVLASEETQIFQAIRLEILMSRNLIARRKAIENIDRLEKQLKKFLDNVGGELIQKEDREYAMSLENLITGEKAAEQSRTTEYTKLQERHERLMVSLKAVRDQRVKEIENSKENMLGLIKMLQNKELMEQEGREMELMRMAGEKEYKEMGQYHEYDDGSVDRLILSAETVEYGDEG